MIFLTGKNDPESVRNVMSLKPASYFLKFMNKEGILQSLESLFITHWGFTLNIAVVDDTLSDVVRLKDFIRNWSYGGACELGRKNMIITTENTLSRE